MSDPRDINRDIADAEALYDSDPGPVLIPCPLCGAPARPLPMGHAWGDRQERAELVHAQHLREEHAVSYECPAGGDHVWTDAVGPEHERYPQRWRWHCDECGASPPDDEDDGIRNGHDRPEEVWGER